VDYDMLRKPATHQPNIVCRTRALARDWHQCKVLGIAFSLPNLVPGLVSGLFFQLLRASVSTEAGEGKDTPTSK